jgi:integrase
LWSVADVEAILRALKARGWETSTFCKARESLDALLETAKNPVLRDMDAARNPLIPKRRAARGPKSGRPRSEIDLTAALDRAGDWAMQPGAPAWRVAALGILVLTAGFGLRPGEARLAKRRSLLRRPDGRPYIVVADHKGKGRWDSNPTAYGAPWTQAALGLWLDLRARTMRASGLDAENPDLALVGRSDGEPYSPQRVCALMRALSAAVGVDFWPRDGRTTYLNVAFEHTSMENVSALARHANIAVTAAYYVSLRPERAANALWASEPETRVLPHANANAGVVHVQTPPRPLSLLCAGGALLQSARETLK